jgi:hypothetical protein
VTAVAVPEVVGVTDDVPTAATGVPVLVAVADDVLVGTIAVPVLVGIVVNVLVTVVANVGDGDAATDWQLGAPPRVMDFSTVASPRSPFSLYDRSTT